MSRSGSLSSINREFDHGGLILGQLFTYSKKRRLVYFEDSGSMVGLVDYSSTPVVSKYKKELCGAGIRPKSLSAVEGSEIGFLACESSFIHVVELEDGSEVRSAFDTGQGSISYVGGVQDRRILFTNGGPSDARILSLWDIRDHIQCDGSCKECEYDTTMFGCTACSTGLVLRFDGSCGVACLTSNTYVDELGRCQKCHISCPMCSGPSANQCSSCDLSLYKGLNNRSECQACTRELCPRCGQGTLCEQCRSHPSLSGCPQEVIDYSVSLRTEGIEKSGDISIYLVVKPETKSLDYGDLKFMIDYGYFQVEADNLSFVGNVTYDKTTKRLQDNGKLSAVEDKSIEFLVYRAFSTPFSEKQFNIVVSLNNSVVKYEQVSSTTSKPQMIIKTSKSQ